MKIEFNVLGRHYMKYKEEYDAAAIAALSSGMYILGGYCRKFEDEYARITDSGYCISLNSGLDALILAVRALGIGPGDEVIVPANTYIATVMAVTANGAAPVFAEPDGFYNIDPYRIEKLITPKTKAILAVHLYGQPARVDLISEIAGRHGLFLIEDCAQSHTAKLNGKTTGTFGDIGCFSFYPTKNIGAFGDGGAVITDNGGLADTIRVLRNYGSREKYYFEREGINSRLDEIQASLLLVKLKHVRELIDERKDIAGKYLRHIDNDEILLPKTFENSEHVWHLFVVRTGSRDRFAAYLQEHNIKTQIHYPVPAHLSGAYSHLGYKKGSFPITEQYADEMLSLPLYNGMTEEEITYIVDVVNDY